MNGGRVYLDHNATTAARPAVIAVMSEVLSAVGNPSSVHAEGRAKRRIVEQAREKVAALVGGDPACVTFTSGGTEASNLALSPTVRDARDPRPVTRLFVSAIEHPAVAAGARFPKAAVETIPVNADGLVDLQAIGEFDRLQQRLVARPERVGQRLRRIRHGRRHERH
ncbi:aminotransferase class V-fold PLP-dependent enzyme, partial [Hansschlegelia beijingensis]